MERGKLIVLSGFSGAGKNSIADKLWELSDRYIYSISATTRKPRKNERNGVDYYFLSEEEFSKKISSGEFLEHATFCGNQYGTPAKPVIEKLNAGRDVILVIECIGALNIKMLFPDAILIFVAVESMKELESRVRNRCADDESAIQSRLEKAKEEALMIPKYDYVIINKKNKLEKSVQLVHSIVTAERAKTACNLDIVNQFVS